MWAYQFQHMQTVAKEHNWTQFVSMQNHYSLCYREEEREMNPYCHMTGVGLIPWAPLYRGLLARPLGAEKTTREESMKGNPMFKGVSLHVKSRFKYLTASRLMTPIPRSSSG